MLDSLLENLWYIYIRLLFIFNQLYIFRFNPEKKINRFYTRSTTQKSKFCHISVCVQSFRNIFYYKQVNEERPKKTFHPHTTTWYNFGFTIFFFYLEKISEERNKNLTKKHGPKNVRFVISVNIKEKLFFLSKTDANAVEWNEKYLLTRI